MMPTPHLTPDALIDLAESRGDGPSRRHVEECAQCREALDTLVVTLQSLQSDEAVEPSPLFWDHFPRRVAAAIDADAPAPRALWWRRRVLWGAAPVAVVAVVVIAVALNSNAPSGALPGPPAAPPVVATAAIGGVSTADAADPTWDVVTTLSDELDDEVDPAAFDGAPGSVERAVEGLSADEQGELVRLLQLELAKRPS